MNRDQVITYLKAERDQLDTVIATLEGSSSPVARAAGRKARPGKRKGKRHISAAGLARIRAAQKARWAKQRAAK